MISDDALSRYDADGTRILLCGTGARGARLHDDVAGAPAVVQLWTTAKSVPTCPHSQHQHTTLLAAAQKKICLRQFAKSFTVASIVTKTSVTAS